jgi:hypothetical protein
LPWGRTTLQKALVTNPDPKGSTAIASDEKLGAHNGWENRAKPFVAFYKQMVMT